MAILFAGEGYNVVINYRPRKMMQQSCAAIIGKNLSVELFRADIAKRES